ncbi:MAG: hypothetical protein LIQ31_09025, partial [Planctomycetes bacterium]|nr:hypothetical protein [Planctomycetota bacterium]
TSALPPVGSIASPLAASAQPPPPVPVTSPPLVGALVSGNQESHPAPLLPAVPMTPMAPDESPYDAETAAYGNAMEPAAVPARPVQAGRRPEPGSRPERRDRPNRAEPQYDVLPLRFADMDQFDQIAMEPYRDRYDSLSVDEKAALYGQQFKYMRGRPPRFAPQASGETEQATQLGRRPEPGSRPERRDRPDRPEGPYDVLPLRFADMDQFDQMAMEPYQDRYDSLSIEEKAALYGQQFEYMRGRPPRFAPQASGEAERTAPAERRPEPGNRPERRDRPDRPEGPYDVLPLRFADMDQYDQIAMEPYRDRYDRLSIGEKASLYGQQFEFMRGRPPRFDPRVSIEAERFQEAAQATDIVAKRQSMYKPALEKPRAPRPDEQSQALLGALPGPWEQEAPPPPSTTTMDDPTYHDFDSDNRMENLRHGVP